MNGQAGYLLLGAWPLIALAERMVRPMTAGAFVAGATALVSLALLGQSRAVIPAMAIGGIVLVAAVPGRLSRVGAIAFVSEGCC